jgi:hypothetical protein
MGNNKKLANAGTNFAKSNNNLLDNLSIFVPETRIRRVVRFADLVHRKQQNQMSPANTATYSMYIFYCQTLVSQKCGFGIGYGTDSYP